MARAFYADDLLQWEAYVSGGQPGTPAAARLYFLCLDAPLKPARYLPWEDGDVATAERALREMSEAELRERLRESVELP